VTSFSWSQSVPRPQLDESAVLYHNEIHKIVAGNARDFKFGTLIDVDMSHLTDNKIPPIVGCGGGSGGKFINFGPLS